MGKTQTLKQDELGFQSCPLLTNGEILNKLMPMPLQSETLSELPFPILEVESQLMSGIASPLKKLVSAQQHSRVPE